ncbi:MAG: hypothetical protein IPM47_10230 [Sphingobacteriales bacterium]|nr:MAG: hypothetical protein IPM47_10230 [Sphingobacteriales bacterium]
MKPVLFPFSIDIDPMSRVLLINFEKDPDTIYVGFEPQVFDDEITGKGHLVIGWRKDGKVDVYYQPTLHPKPEKYDIAGKGLNELIKTGFEVAEFEINESGVQSSYVFSDCYGRKIDLHIEEQNKTARKPFDLLAPMGHAAENPSALPLILLYDFYFVRKKDTKLRVSINGKEHRPDSLPLPMDCMWMYFLRYSSKPLIATLNPQFKGELSPVWLNEIDVVLTDNKYEWHFSEQDGEILINKLVRLNLIAPIALHFNPPFPDLYRFLPKKNVEGRFNITGKPSIGYIEGKYSVRRVENQFYISLTPSSGWIPKPDKLVLRFLYFIVKPFKNWPKTYRWEANITINSDKYYMESKWIRTK